jgi:hypothetical protein
MGQCRRNLCPKNWFGRWIDTPFVGGVEKIGLKGSISSRGQPFELIEPLKNRTFHKSK